MSLKCHTVEFDTHYVNRCIFVEQRMPKARKLHSCDECHKLIQKGEQYIREILKYGQELFHHKYCEDCFSVREVFFSSGWAYCYLWEQTSNFIADCNGQVSEYQITQVTKPARDKICTMIEEMWDD